MLCRNGIAALAIACLALMAQFLMPTARASAEERTTMLIEAATDGDLEAVKRLIDQGITLETRDAARRTPLLIATRNDHLEVAAALIAAGADVNAKDNIRDTPFLYAGAEGRNAVLRLILASGRANLADTNRYGGTALIPAAHHGHPETVRMLLETAIDIDHVNRLGWTALMEAVILGDGGPVYREIVGDLVRAGARDIADNDGVTALEHARRLGYAEIERLIAAGRG